MWLAARNLAAAHPREARLRARASALVRFKHVLLLICCIIASHRSSKAAPRVGQPHALAPLVCWLLLAARAGASFAQYLQHLLLEVALDFVQAQALLCQEQDALREVFVTLLVHVDFLVQPVLIVLQFFKYRLHSGDHEELFLMTLKKLEFKYI